MSQGLTPRQHPHGKWYPFNCWPWTLRISADSKDLNGFVVGVLPYIAPEVLCGKQYTTAADIYSFGVVIWVILAHQQPYSDKNWEDEQFQWDIIEGLRLKIPHAHLHGLQNSFRIVGHTSREQTNCPQNLWDYEIYAKGPGSGCSGLWPITRACNSFISPISHIY